jgi:adenylate cyclase
MAETAHLPRFSEADRPERVRVDEAYANRFTESTLERHKREGLELSVRARWVALSVVAVMLPFLNPSWEVLYYEVLLVLLAWLGWLQQRIGRVGRSGAELAVLAIELALMVFIITVPNPYYESDWPTAMILRFDTFDYLFIILAGGTLSYSWRTIMAIGNWTAAFSLIALGLLWWFGRRNEAMSQAAQEAFGPGTEMARMLDPNSINFDVRIQQIVIFVIVAYTLALSVRRFNRLLLGNAALERERENLARYFSPNVVEELSRNDDPLKQIRSHDVAVIFADIQGFTRYAAKKPPEDVINTLREFHGLMERAVFAQNGTLDKYMGDGLMATFGTPLPKPDDTRRAYHCARRMVDLAAEWNAEREARGSEPLAVSVGLHCGPVVVGDIGGNRLEFAVIGNTVNVASRLESLTRPLGTRLVISDEVYRGLPAEEVQDLVRIDDQEIRGIDGEITVWTLP